MDETGFDQYPIDVSNTIRLTRRMAGMRNDGSQLINVCVKTDEGQYAAIEAITCSPDGMFSYKDKPIGTIDSPEFLLFMKKYQSGPDLSSLTDGPAPKNDNELFQRVSEVYAETNSIKKTAKLLTLSEEKSRRILFTTKDYTCETHEKVMALLKEGKSLEDVSDAVGVSRRKIHAYLPYGV
jgi:hypothetical protein